MANEEDLGRLIVRVGLDGSEFTQGSQNLEDKMKLVQSQMKASSASFKDYGKNIDALRSKQEGLSKLQELQGQKVKQLRDRYDELVRTQGENSQAALRVGNSLNNAIAYYNRLGNQVDSVGNQIRTLSEDLTRQNSVWHRAQSSLTSFRDRARETGESFKDVGEKMSVGVTAPLAALGGLALKAASDFQQSQGKIQASLGVTDQDAKALNESARAVWKDGFGENVDEASQGLIEVRKNLKNITGKELENVTKQAFILAQTFGYDVPESTRAAKALIDNFGVDASKAFDYITVAAQKGGDFSQELLDTISEYSVQFKAAGISVDGMFNILLQGAQNGAFNLDKVGDSVKEFTIRAVDGSKTTAQGFQMIGLNADQMSKKFAEGGDKAQAAFMATVAGLAAMKDPLKQNQAGVSLFGTQWEDVKKNVIASMNPTKDMLGEVAGATEKAGKALNDNLGSRVQSDLRKLGDSLIPFGNVLLNVIEPAMDSASGKIEEFTNWMKGLSPESQKTIIAVAGIVAAIGPLVTGLGFAISGLGAMAGGLAALTGPVGLTVLALAGLGAGFVALESAMDKPVIKSDIFAGKVSEATQKVVGSYTKMKDEAGVQLNLMALSQEKITDDMVNGMVQKYQSMTDQILSKLDERYNKEKEKMIQFFAESDVLSNTEEQKVLSQMDEQHAAQRQKVVDYNNQEVQIITESKTKTGTITEEARKQIEEIEMQKYQVLIEAASQNKTEQETILTNLKNSSGALTTEKAAQTVAKSAEERDKAIADANNKYNGVIDAATRERDEGGKISKEDADKIIADAQNKKQQAIANAEDMHYNVVNEAQKQAGEHADQVNWETGQVLSNWDDMYNGVLTTWNWVRGIFGKDPLPLRGSVKENGRQAQKRQNASLRAKGTPPGDRHLGGPAIVGEEGRELAYIPGQGVTMLGSRGPEFLDLPAGTSILPNKYTESLLRMYGFPGYADGVGDFFNVFLKGTGAAWNYLKDKFSLGNNFPSWLTNLVGNPVDSMADMAKDAIKNLFGDFMPSGGGSGVQRWAGIAAQALMMTGQYTKANLDKLLYQMQTESGGNPQAINLWDSNAKRGIPSKGLMQVIDPTFRAYAMPGYNKDIYDPLSNILASIRYALARYGSLAKAYKGVGYATGGEVNSQQYALLGENGYKEWVITSEPRYRRSNLGLLAEAGQALGVPTIPSVSNVNGSGAAAANGLSVVIDRLNQVIDKFEAAINTPIFLESTLVAEGRELARASYKYVTEFQDQESGRKSRFGG